MAFLDLFLACWKQILEKKIPIIHYLTDLDKVKILDLIVSRWKLYSFLFDSHKRYI